MLFIRELKMKKISFLVVACWALSGQAQFFAWGGSSSDSVFAGVRSKPTAVPKPLPVETSHQKLLRLTDNLEVYLRKISGENEKNTMGLTSNCLGLFKYFSDKLNESEKQEYIALLSGSEGVFLSAKENSGAVRILSDSQHKNMEEFIDKAFLYPWGTVGKDDDSDSMPMIFVDFANVCMIGAGLFQSIGDKEKSEKLLNILGVFPNLLISFMNFFMEPKNHAINKNLIDFLHYMDQRKGYAKDVEELQKKGFDFNPQTIKSNNITLSFTTLHKDTQALLTTGFDMFFAYMDKVLKK
jgi:hypothetical protein